MTTPPSQGSELRLRLLQRRINVAFDQLRPGRWNWSAIIAPLEERVVHGREEALSPATIRNLRYFLVDGTLSAVSENLYFGFIVLFALSYGASNSAVGWISAIANLMGALAFFPGAWLLERTGRRKPLVLWSGGGLARISLLLLALIPLFFAAPAAALIAIVVLNGLRAFFANFANPAWTALVAEIVPEQVRGRYLSNRSTLMGIAALLVAPLAGRLIAWGNDLLNSDQAGYQITFALACGVGLLATVSFSRISDSGGATVEKRVHHRGDLRRALRAQPAFIGFVISAFIFNLALQIAGPFFNVYLVNGLGAGPTAVGLVASVSSLAALAGQRVFGPRLDRRGAIWVALTCGFLIPAIPFAWLFVTAPWQVGLINLFGGFVWAGYNLATFNLLLTLTPEVQRPRAVALYQTAVFSSAFIGPVLGGYLADVVSFKLLFALSSAGRLLGMMLFWRFVARKVTGR